MLSVAANETATQLPVGVSISIKISATKAAWLASLVTSSQCWKMDLSSAAQVTRMHISQSAASCISNIPSAMARMNRMRCQ